MKKNWIKRLIKVGLDNEAYRVAWVKNVLQEIPPGVRILDAGAGELKYKKFCTHLEYVSQDFAKYNGVGDASGLQTGSWDQSKLDIVSDITSIPEPDKSFDAIMCIEVFEHLPDPVKAIQEFARLLKPGGKLILTAPFCSLTHFAPYHFYSGFNQYFYSEYLPRYGLEILELSKNGNFHEYLAQEILRLPTIVRQYNKVKLKPWEYLQMYFILRALKRYSKRDTGSEEILYFGCHILAEKKTNNC